MCLVRLDINIGHSADIGVAEQVRNNPDISGTIKDYAIILVGRGLLRLRDEAAVWKGTGTASLDIILDNRAKK